jgi:hypothetical protein
MNLQTADLLDFVTLLLVETRLENKFHTSLNNCRDLHKRYLKKKLIKFFARIISYFTF